MKYITLLILPLLTSCTVQTTVPQPVINIQCVEVTIDGIVVTYCDDGGTDAADSGTQGQFEQGVTYIMSANSWNYRVMKIPGGAGEEDVYGIHEVYYDDNDNLQAYTENPVGVVSENVEGLELDLRRMLDALNEGVLTPDDFPKEESN